MNKIVIISLAAFLVTACSEKKESVDTSAQNLIQCMESDPNPMLVELRKMSKESPSAKLALKQTCEEIAKSLK